MKRKMAKLHRQYSRLTVFERTELFLAAQARGDPDEMRALDDTCPAADVDAYLCRVFGLCQAACLLVIQLFASEVLVLTAYASLLQDAGAAPDAASDAADATSDTAATGPNTNGAQLPALLARQAALWRGFAAWCRDMRHDPSHALRAAPFGMDESDPAYYILHQQIQRFQAGLSPPDPDEVQQWHDIFAGFSPPKR